MKTKNVIVRPVLTEKATQLTRSGVYTFQVDLKVNKHQIAEVLESVYKVKVGDVRMMIRIGKIKKVGRRNEEKKLPNTKIAYVKVISGKLDIFPQA